MYKVTTSLFKLPKEFTKFRKVTNFGEVYKIVSTVGFSQLHYCQRYNTNNKHNESLRRFSYKYLLYSALFGATAFSSYKIW